MSNIIVCKLRQEIWVYTNLKNYGSRFQFTLWQAKPLMKNFVKFVNDLFDILIEIKLFMESVVISSSPNESIQDIYLNFYFYLFIRFVY